MYLSSVNIKTLCCFKCAHERSRVIFQHSSSIFLRYSVLYLFTCPVFVLLAFTHVSKIRSLSKVLIFISLLVWSGIHFSQLKQLQAYYKTQHTGESWQQYGAL